MIAILVLAFVLSGAAGLIYELIWTRYLGLFVGHSAYAQIIVLVVFLGGMSIGAHLASRRSSALKAPLLWYAGIEFVVGLMSLGFHAAFTGVTSLAYDAIFPALGGFTLIGLKWLLAGALILPQSILLGATFPLMSAGVIRIARAQDAPGRILSTLYFANSLGAAGGVLLAGFALLEAVGLPGTLTVAASVNIAVAIVVGLLARTTQGAGIGVQGAGADVASGDSNWTPGPLWRPLLIVAFGTAVASFIYEIAWLRMLALVLGSATHSFELMLSAFILGLALGALWIRRRADTLTDPVRFLGVVQWTMGLLAVATLPLYLQSFEWVSALLNTVQANANGYRVFIVARYAIALLIMVPATFCAGMTLPLITRVLMRSGAGERAVGAVYAWNTVGSIVGVVLAGLVLMPVLGLKLLLITGASLDIALGIWLVARAAIGAPAASPARWWPAGRVGVVAAGLVTAGMIVVVAMLARFDRGRLTSGVYRYGNLYTERDLEFLFYRDGRTATVSLRRAADGTVTLATNGKPDASLSEAWINALPSQQLRHDQATQMLLAIVPLAHVPRAEHIAVIGHGSGMSAHVLLGSPHVTEVVTIEIEPEMINASAGFAPVNRRVFEDPRARFVIDDAKSYFASSRKRFDLIMSEPSNPWVSGVSGLFTVEFYERVRRQLSDSGVFAQWLHLYENSDALASGVFAAIDEAFPYYDIFYTSNADVVVLASVRPLPAPAWNVVAYPGIAEDLRSVVAVTPDQLESLRMGDRAVLGPMLRARGIVNSDYAPVLDLGAEGARFLQQSARGYMGLSESPFDVVAALTGRRTGFGRTIVPVTPDVPRSSMRAIGAALRASRALPRRTVARGLLMGPSRAAAYRLDQLDRMASSSQPPIDWNRWMEHVIAADNDLHGGTAGVVDSAFFASMRRYAARTGAPKEARAGLDFLHGIRAWDWREVVAASAVVRASAGDATWIPAGVLRSGTIVAYLKLGEIGKAREAARKLPRAGQVEAFNEALLEAYVSQPDSAHTPRATSR